MGQVAITLNDRTYRLVCDDGEEDRLVELASFVKAKVETLRTEVGHVGDERLMLMAALMIADELFDARAATDSGLRETPSPVAQPQSDQSFEPEAVKSLRAVAAKMATERHGGLVSKEADPAPKQAGDRSRRRTSG